MAAIGVGKQIVNITNQQLAQELANLYQNYYLNRNKIQSMIDSFILRTRARKVMEVHTKTSEYKIVHPDLTYFKEGHALLNNIRALLGLEEVDYRIGILDDINGKAYQVNVNHEEFETLMRKRGDKSGLLRTMRSINELLDAHQEEENFDITNKFLSFVRILESKTEKNNDNLNYGYAFEAYGHFEFKDGRFKDSRHQTYYNYYKASRKNTAAWTTGGDVNSTQYKLIHIYRDEKGRRQISSASVTSANTIITELINLKNLLGNETMTSGEVSIVLAKHFTQLDLENKIDDGLIKILEETIEKTLKNKT